jgi:hypothetical protein
MPELKPQIYTVGHSTHPIEDFLSLLTGAGVEAVAGLTPDAVVDGERVHYPAQPTLDL